MNIYLKEKTVEEYALYWQRFICFCFRAMHGPPIHQTVPYGFRFTVEQRKGLEELRVLYEFSKRTTMAVEQRGRRLIETSMLFIQQHVYDVGVPVLVYFSGVMGYRKETGLWREPANFTNILAGILWCMCMLVLEFTLPQCK